MIVMAELKIRENKKSTIYNVIKNELTVVF